MPVKPNREYRSFQLMQPADDTAGYIVEGYATTFNDPYDFGYGAKEVIDRHALDGANMKDVIFQLNHEGLVMARMRNDTLIVNIDDHGLYVKADLGGSVEGRNLYEAIKNGLIDRMSWGFIIANDGWEWDEATRTSTITKVDKVFDVSAVSIPANEGTVIKARSYLDGVIEQEQQELLLREKKEREARIRAALSLRIHTLER